MSYVVFGGKEVVSSSPTAATKDSGIRRITGSGRATASGKTKGSGSGLTDRIVRDDDGIIDDSEPSSSGWSLTAGLGLAGALALAVGVAVVRSRSR